MDALWERMEFVGTLSWMLCGNGWSLWERYNGWAMDALWERMEFVGTLTWLVGTDGVCGNVGWAMDALWKRMEFVGTLSWLGHGCSVGRDGACGNVIMFGPGMLCENGWSLWERYHGWHMDALWERMEFVGTLSWLVGTDGVCGNVIMVGPWMLCGKGWSLWECYHGWAMDALWERMELVGTLSWLGHGCSVGMDGVCGKRYGIGERAEAENAESAREFQSGQAESVGKRKYDMKHLCKRGKTLGRRHPDLIFVKHSADARTVGLC
ncbi:unnamed protein product [Symbiodinium sp. KB8]|nr:unnamed protein product [Symbiodinium sp. KB8]